MINALIIDDEEHCIERLRTVLHTHFQKYVHLQTTCNSVTEGLNAIAKFQPDLIFLDVQLHDKTGFDLLKAVPELNFEVIFTTAYEQYAIQAFKFSAVDYLLKPIQTEDLAAALDKLKEKMSREEISRKFETLFHNLRDFQSFSKRITIPTLNGLVFLEIKDIIRCEADINYTHIYLNGGQRITVAKTLKEFEEMLSAYQFYRIHNSHLVNLLYIKSYNKGKGGYISLTDNSQLEVSSRRKDDFLKRLSEL